MPSALKINIATPAYGGKLASVYVASLFRLMTMGRHGNHQFSYSSVDYADVAVSRNYLISNFYFHQKECSHLLFIDDDMGYEPDLIHEMLALEQDVVGVLYAKRKLDLRRMHASRDAGFPQAYARACEFIGATTWPSNWPGFVEVDMCGAGIMLISRRCVDAMIERCPGVVDDKRFRRLPFGGQFEKFLTPFNKIELDDRELSEDFAFCHRWREFCGGKIYASTSRKVQHVGELVVDTRYDDLFPAAGGNKGAA